MDDFASILNDQLKQLKEAVRKRGRVNLLVAGKTGVGKSTLINAVFQGNFASTGQGRPATRNTRKIKKKGVPLYIFDTRGLELDRFLESLEELEDLICGLAQSEDPNEHIHCAWLCISEDGRRIEDAEIKLLNLLAKHIPVVVVITKSRADNGFRSEVQRLLPRASNVIRVRAIPELQDDGHVLGPMNLTDLVEWTMQVIPDGQKNAFAAAQRVTLRLKRERAHLIVASATTAAAGIGAFPIPCPNPDFDAGQHHRHFRPARRYRLFYDAGQFNAGGSGRNASRAFRIGRISALNSWSRSNSQWTRFGRYRRSLHDRVWGSSHCRHFTSGPGQSRLSSDRRRDRQSIETRNGQTKSIPQEEDQARFELFYSIAFRALKPGKAITRDGEELNHRLHR